MFACLMGVRIGDTMKLTLECAGIRVIALGNFTLKKNTSRQFQPRSPKKALTTEMRLRVEYHVLLSIMYKKEPRYRRIAMDEMKRLVEKFSDAAGAEETAAGEDTSVVEKTVVSEDI